MEPIDVARIGEDVPLLEGIRTTRAIRRLRPDPVPLALVKKVCEAGTFAPRIVISGNSSCRISPLSGGLRSSRLSSMNSRLPQRVRQFLRGEDLRGLREAESEFEPEGRSKADMRTPHRWIDDVL